MSLFDKIEKILITAALGISISGCTPLTVARVETRQIKSVERQGSVLEEAVNYAKTSKKERAYIYCVESNRIENVGDGNEGHVVPSDSAIGHILATTYDTHYWQIHNHPGTPEEDYESVLKVQTGCANNLTNILTAKRLRPELRNNEELLGIEREYAELKKVVDSEAAFYKMDVNGFVINIYGAMPSDDDVRYFIAMQAAIQAVKGFEEKRLSYVVMNRKNMTAVEFSGGTRDDEKHIVEEYLKFKISIRDDPKLAEVDNPEAAREYFETKAQEFYDNTYGKAKIRFAPHNK